MVWSSAYSLVRGVESLTNAWGHFVYFFKATHYLLICETFATTVLTCSGSLFLLSLMVILYVRGSASGFLLNGMSREVVMRPKVLSHKKRSWNFTFGPSICYRPFGPFIVKLSIFITGILPTCRHFRIMKGLSKGCYAVSGEAGVSCLPKCRIECDALRLNTSNLWK